MANNTKKLFFLSTEDEVKELNPWKEEFVTKSESTLYDPNAKWVLNKDEETIDKYNEENKPDYKFILSNRPEPFTGNPLKAKVVILTLNPGYVERANKDIAMELQESGSKDILQAVINHKDEQLRLEAKSFFCPRIKKNGNLSYREATVRFLVGDVKLSAYDLLRLVQHLLCCGKQSYFLRSLQVCLLKSLSLQFLPSQHQLGAHIILKLGSDVERLGFGKRVERHHLLATIWQIVTFLQERKFAPLYFLPR